MCTYASWLCPINNMDNFSRVVPLIRTLWWQYLSFYDCTWLFHLDVYQNCKVQLKPFGTHLFDLNKKLGCGSLKDLSLGPRSTLRWRNLKIQQSPVILDLCLRKNSGKEIILLSWCRRCLENLRFQNAFGPKRKAGVFKFLRFKGVFDKPRFRDELMWMIGL